MIRRTGSSTDDSPAAVRSAARHAAHATMAQFFMNGATFATWGIEIPLIKAHFAVSDTVLSVAMLSVAAGAVLAMGQVGRWIARVGSAHALPVAGVACAVMLTLLPLAPSFALLLPLLLLFGMVSAAFDVSMNVQAARVESVLQQPIMSTLHGMFSLGGMAGAAVGGVLIAADVPLWLHSALVALLTAVAALCAVPWLLTDRAHSEDDAPTPAQSAAGARALVIVGIVAFLGLVCEGAMYDWAAVYARDIGHLAAGHASYAYATFSTGMALGRFAADAIRRTVRGDLMLMASAWLGCAGIALALLWPEPWAIFGGFFMMGLGVANFMPYFFLVGAQLPGMTPAAGVAGVARFAYAGMLLGPPIIGGLTHLANLRASLAVVAFTMVCIAWQGIRRASHAAD